MKNVIFRKTPSIGCRLDCFSSVKKQTMILIPSEAAHSSLDLFEKPHLLATFNQRFDQKNWTAVFSSGLRLEFEMVGDRNNFMNLQNKYLEFKCRIQNADGSDLRCTTCRQSNCSKFWLQILSTRSLIL